MNPETLNQQTDQAPVVDGRHGRHPFDQGVSSLHWGSVMADIDSRAPQLPQLNIQIAEFDQLPTAAIVFDAEAITPTATEQKQQRLIDRAKEAWGMFSTTVKFPELKPLAAPALAVTIAACNAGTGQVPNSPDQSKEPESPIVIASPDISQEPVSPSPSVKPTPYPGTGNTEPEVTPTPKPAPPPTPEVTLPPSPITRQGLVDALIAYQKGDKNALNDYKKTVTKEDLTASFEAFASSNSFTQYVDRFVKENSEAILKNCIGAKDATLREVACSELGYYSIKAAEFSRDPAAIDFAQNITGFILVTVAKKDSDMIEVVTKTMQAYTDINK